MRWTVYLLASPTRTYVGVTTDLRRRLEQHNGTLPGGAKSTRAGRPWSIVRSWGPFTSRAKAQRIEFRVKQLDGTKRHTWSFKGVPRSSE